VNDPRAHFVGLEREKLATLDTPCYIFDPSRVERDYVDLKRSLGTPLVVSLKANPNLDLLIRSVHAFTDGIELASQRELDLVVGRAIPKFVNTPALGTNFLRAALAARATLVLDNLCQVDLLIGQVAGRAVRPVMLRLNAAEIVGGLRERGLGDHFGMSVEDLLEAGKRLSAAGIALRGVHAFAGSNMLDQYAPSVLRSTLSVVERCEQALGARMELVNVGGGIPASWRSSAFDFPSYREQVESLRGGRTIVHEAGRAVFAACGHFVTRVVSVKRLGPSFVAACDGGIAHSFLLAQTEQVMKQVRAPLLVCADDAPRSEALAPVLLVGNSCNRRDCIGRLETGALMPKPGDFCVFDGVGAYHSTYTLTGFLSLKASAIYTC